MLCTLEFDFKLVEITHVCIHTYSTYTLVHTNTHTHTICTCAPHRYLVSQLMERDLSDVVRDHKSKRKAIPDSTIRLVIYQLFRALKVGQWVGVVTETLPR